jgi:hypothetical protein
MKLRSCSSRLHIPGLPISPGSTCLIRLQSERTRVTSARINLVQPQSQTLENLDEIQPAWNFRPVSWAQAPGSFSSPERAAILSACPRPSCCSSSLCCPSDSLIQMLPPSDSRPSPVTRAAPRHCWDFCRQAQARSSRLASECWAPLRSFRCHRGPHSLPCSSLSPAEHASSNSSRPRRAKRYRSYTEGIR